MSDASPYTSYQSSDFRALSRDCRIWLAGHRGMVGSAFYRRMQTDRYANIITRSHGELDLADQAAVRNFFQNEKIDAIILAAARVGGIHANNSYPAEFIYENIMIQTNVIHEAYRSGVDRLLFLGSSCIYPKYAGQPMREEALLTGLLEPTNEPYAIAKIAGIKLCESYNRQYGTHYRAVMPTNLYGPHDNFDLENSHVLPAMIRKFHLAKLAREQRWVDIQADEKRFGSLPAGVQDGLRAIAQAGASESQLPAGIRLWGSGRPRREFLHVDDLAAACLFLLNLPDDIYDAVRVVPSGPQDRSAPQGPSAVSEHDINEPMRVSHLNVGAGEDICISDLAETVQHVVGYAGAVSWDRSKPDGSPRKLLDISRLARLGWKPEISLADGIQRTYRWYLTQSGLL